MSDIPISGPQLTEITDTVYEAAYAAGIVDAIKLLNMQHKYPDTLAKYEEKSKAAQAKTEELISRAGFGITRGEK